MVTKQQAMTCRMFYHATLKNRDGSAVRCRANGQCKTWKTRTDDFRLPVKYGLKMCFYITPRNADEWSIWEPEEKEALAASVGLSADVPDGILYDKLQECS